MYFNAISIDFYAVSCLSALIMCKIHVYNWENANTKDLNAWRILMNLLCIYLGEGRGMHLCMYIYGNTKKSAFTTELLDGYLWNLEGMKFSLPAHVFRLVLDPPWGGSKAGQEGVKESFKDTFQFHNVSLFRSTVSLIFPVTWFNHL